MNEFTLHTGCQCNRTRINIDWFDENNVTQKTVLDVLVQEQDKPRTLEIMLNGAVIATVPRV